MIEARFFKGSRGQPATSRVRAHRVVESLNVSKNSISGQVKCLKMKKMQTLALEAAEEVFSDSVVIGIALSAHALDKSSIQESGSKTRGGVLDATVGMKDQARRRSLSANRHVESA